MIPISSSPPLRACGTHTTTILVSDFVSFNIPISTSPPFRRFFPIPTSQSSPSRKLRTNRKQLACDCLRKLMGIPNLLRFLKPFIEPVHIKKYAGKRVNRSPFVFHPAVPLSFFFSDESRGDVAPNPLTFSSFWIYWHFVLRRQVGIDAYSWLHKGGSIPLYCCNVLSMIDSDSFADFLIFFSYFLFMVLQPILAVWSYVWTLKAPQPGDTSATSCTTSTSCGITRLSPSSSLTGAACLARWPLITSGRGTVIRVVMVFLLR